MLAIIGLQLAVLFSLAWLTDYYRKNNAQYIAFVAAKMPMRVDEAKYMLPPAVGLLYSMQTLRTMGSDYETTELFGKWLSETLDERQTLVHALSQSEYRAALATCYERRQHHIEEELLKYRVSSIGSNHIDLYRQTAELCARTGLVDDAKAHYARYLSLGRAVVYYTTNLDLSLAQVRYKALTPGESLRTRAWNVLLDGSLTDILPYLASPDPGIRSLAIFTSASKEYRSGDIRGALKLLRAHEAHFGSLKDECDFLVAKLIGYIALDERTAEQVRSGLDDCGAAFKALAARLVPDHYLLDDVYAVWATIEKDPQRRIAVAKEGLRRCRGGTPEVYQLKDIIREAMRGDTDAK